MAKAANVAFSLLVNLELYQCKKIYAQLFLTPSRDDAIRDVHAATPVYLKLIFILTNHSEKIFNDRLQNDFLAIVQWALFFHNAKYALFSI